MGLNAAAPTDSHIFLNLNEGADEDIVADNASINVDRLDDRDVLAEVYVYDAVFS
jgi:hypothetical protein